MATVDILIRLRQAGGEAIRQINTQLRATRQNLEQVREASGALLQAGTQITALGASITAAGAIPVKFAADFESALGAVKGLLQGTGASTDEVAKDFEELSAVALKLGETTQFTATQTAEAITFLQRAGFETEEVIGSLAGTLRLAAVENISLAESADIASNILSGFGIEAEKFDEVVDILAKTTTNANTNLIELGEALKTAAPIASSAGISIEETSAVIGQLGNAGLKATVAGTAFRAIIRSLLAPSDQAAKKIKELGLNTTDAQGNFVGVASIVRQLEGSIDSLGGKAEQTAALIEIFGQRGGPGIAALLKQGSDSLDEFIEKVENAGGTAQIIADTRLDTLSGSFTKLLSAVEGFLIKIGTPFLRVVKAAVDGLTAFVGVLSSVFDSLGPIGPILLGVVTAVGALTAALGLLLVALGGAGLAITGLSTGLTALTGVLGITTVAVKGFALATTIAFAKIAAVVAVAIAAFKFGQFIADLEIAGVKVSDFAAVVILQIQKLISFANIGFQALKKAFLEIISLGFIDTRNINNRIREEAEFIKALGDEQVRILRTKEIAQDAARERLIQEKQKQDALKETKKALEDIEEPPPFTGEVDKEIDALAALRRETELLVDQNTTKIAELTAAFQRGNLDQATLLEVRRRLLERSFNAEVKLLEERIAAEEDFEKQQDLRLQLDKRRETQARANIKLLQEEEKAERDLLAAKVEVVARLDAIEERTLGDTVEDIKRRNDLELDELERRQEKEIELLERKNATVSQINDAIRLQELERARLAADQAEALLERQVRVAEQLLALEQSSLGSSLEDRRRANELELAEIEQSNQEVIAELTKQGATEEQIAQATLFAQRAVTVRRAQLEEELTKSVQEEVEKRNQEKLKEIQQEQQLQLALIQLRQQATADTDTETQNALELEAFDIRAEQQLQRLRDLNATQLQINDARRQLDLQREKLVSDQIISVWQNRLSAAQSIAGGLSQAFQQFFEATGKQNKALFIASKAAAIGQATINVAVGVTKALAEGGPILGPIQAAIIAALGGVQIAKIATQRLAAGGPVVGGTGYRDDVPILAMGGEYVVNKRATQYYGPGFLTALNAMMIPRVELAAAGLMHEAPPLSIPPTLTAQAGGFVPQFQQQQAVSERAINIVNLTDPDQLGQYLGSVAGEEQLLNFMSNRADDVNARLSQ